MTYGGAYCWRCGHRAPEREGVSACKVDGLDVLRHIEQGQCPKGHSVKPDPRDALTADKTFKPCCGQ